MELQMKKYFIFLTIVFLLGTLFAGCKKEPAPEPAPEPVADPVISTSPLSDTIVSKGQTVVFRWNITGQCKNVVVTKNGIVFYPAVSGNRSIEIIETTVMAISCESETGKLIEKKVTFTVEVQIPPPTVALSTNHTSIIIGDSSVLNWTSTNADSITLFTQPVSKPRVTNSGLPKNGSLSVSPREDTKYTLKAYNKAGRDSATVIITVNPLPVPTIEDSICLFGPWRDDRYEISFDGPDSGFSYHHGSNDFKMTFYLTPQKKMKFESPCGNQICIVWPDWYINNRVLNINQSTIKLITTSEMILVYETITTGGIPCWIKCYWVHSQ